MANEQKLAEAVLLLGGVVLDQIAGTDTRLPRDEAILHVVRARELAAAVQRDLAEVPE